VSFEARRTSDGPISNAQHFDLPEVPDFSTGVSHSLLINIKVQRESKDYPITSSVLLLMTRRKWEEKTFRHRSLSSPRAGANVTSPRGFLMS
jgi:hypothetical protein